jgi:hypothetical protein
VFGQHFGRSYESVSYKYSYIKNTGRTGRKMRLLSCLVAQLVLKQLGLSRTRLTGWLAGCFLVAGAVPAAHKRAWLGVLHGIVDGMQCDGNSSADVLCVLLPCVLLQGRRARPSTPRPSMTPATKRWRFTPCSRCGAVRYTLMAGATAGSSQFLAQAC